MRINKQKVVAHLVEAPRYKAGNGIALPLTLPFSVYTTFKSPCTILTVHTLMTCSVHFQAAWICTYFHLPKHSQCLRDIINWKAASIDTYIHLWYINCVIDGVIRRPWFMYILSPIRLRNSLTDYFNFEKFLRLESPLYKGKCFNWILNGPSVTYIVFQYLRINFARFFTSFFSFLRQIFFLFARL